jgi:hypothetical protein
VVSSRQPVAFSTDPQREEELEQSAQLWQYIV